MQFRAADYARIAAGELTLTFRRWRRPQARAGRRYRIGTGIVMVEDVRRIEAKEITPAEARAAGCQSVQEVLETIEQNRRRGADRIAPLYRIALRYAGEEEDPRARLAANEDLDNTETAALLERLRKMDARSRRGAWTAATLAAIAGLPGQRARDLAAAQGCNITQFKADVRKLKALGLTISMETGYKLSPRGRVVLSALEELP